MAELEVGRTTGTDARAAAAVTGPPVGDAHVDALPIGGVLRDITRGGLAGLVVGIVVGGIGGRIVMRLAALLVPDASGSITENGNVIGAITPGGTIALVVFVGLFVGASAGVLWVSIEPWLPRRPLLRVALTVPIALGLGINGLIEDRNPDFTVLGHAPVVIASLVVLVALVGPALVAVDRWLDARLPHPGRDDTAGLAGYVTVTVIGLLLTVGLVVPQFLGSDLALTGQALIAVGICTLVSWLRRLRGDRATPPLLTAIARVGLALATVAGLSVAAREVVGALGAG